MRRPASAPFDGAGETYQMPTFPPRARSAARDKLAETQAARAEVDAKLAALQASVTKLNAQSAEVGPAEAALANFDAAEDHRALLWARGEGPRPEPDVEVRRRLTRELEAARFSAESANRSSSVVVAEMTAEASKPADIAKWADSAVVEILAETATPLIADLESDAIALVAKIVGLQTAAGLARDIAERRRPRVLTVEEHAMRNIGKGVAIQHAELEDGTPPEARVAVGALTERLRPGVWAKISAAIIDALHTRHADISEKVTETVGLWRAFESDLRTDAGVHFAGVK
jgi:hypothetical protein